MGGYAAGRTGPVLAGLVLVMAIASGALAGEAEFWMPETLPGLMRALEVGIARELTPPERTALRSGTRRELRETHPELHEKIRHCYVRWTDAWIRRAARELESVPARRLRRAEEAAADVDRRLRAHFKARGWRYRPMKVVFLPQRLMNEPGLPSIRARGLHVLYYPDVFFASLEAQATLPHTLIHESLHFNQADPELGRSLTEGIAEAAATELALSWGLADKRSLREATGYADELRTVEHILARMTERTGIGREQALEILLHTYLTGDATQMETIFGAAAWSEVVRASRERKKVHKTAKRFLGS